MKTIHLETSHLNKLVVMKRDLQVQTEVKVEEIKDITDPEAETLEAEIEAEIEVTTQENTISIRSEKVIVNVKRKINKRSASGCIG